MIMKNTDKLIVPLDLTSFEKMNQVVEDIGEIVSTYKIGHQLFTAEGPRTIRYLKGKGKTVFLDLKLHEISSSVAAAVTSAGSHGVDMVTVHASGGRRMMQAAVEAASHFPAMKILAITVVTELDDSDLEEIGFTHGCEEQVVRLATLAKQCGCHGLIASPQEVETLRKTLGSELLIVTPGVRPAGSNMDNQTRSGTPAQAIRSGASFIIVGRPILKADSPRQAAREIAQEISSAILKA